MVTWKKTREEMTQGRNECLIAGSLTKQNYLSPAAFHTIRK